MSAPLVPGLPDVRVRRRVPEWMDDPALSGAQHREALDALARVNRLSLAGRRVAGEVLAMARSGRVEPGRPVRLLDVACGGGDVLRAVARAAERAGVAVELHGCDRSEAALAHARERLDGRSLELHRVDVLAEPLPGRFDLVACSLFLHHLDEDDAVRLLAAMGCAGRVMLVQDLRRSRLSYALAAAGLQVLTRSPVARVDGRRSVRAAFTMREARALCARAGLPDARVRRAWPQRFTIRWAAREAAHGSAEGAAP